MATMTPSEFWKWLKDYAEQQNKGKGNSDGSRSSNNPYLDNTGQNITGDPLGNLDWLNYYNQGSQDQNGQFNNAFTNFSSFASILNKFHGNNDIAGLLNALGFKQDPSNRTAWMEDWNKQLVETLLNYMLTKENRSYNEGLRDEQRLYDSPTNQLARLMGAGISRDAALQLLGGSGASGAAGVPYSSAIAGSPGIATSQSSLNDAQRKTAIANTVFNGIQTLESLVGCGIGIGQAIPQISMLNAQNFMSQDQLDKYKATNQVTSVLNNAISTGAASYDELNNVAHAQEFLNNNKDNPNIKPLFDNGAYDAVFGSTLGLGMMSQHWDNVLKARHSGDIMDKFLRHEDLSNDLGELNLATGRRDYYMGFAKEFQDLLKGDAEIANLWNQYQIGQKQISINGEILEQEKYHTKSAKRQNDIEQVNYDSFMNALDMKDEDGNTGRSFLTYHEFTKLVRMYQSDVVLSAGAGTVSWTGQDGKTYQGTPRQRYQEYLNGNINAAVTGAFIYDLVNSNRLEGYNGPVGGLYKFADMWQAAGLDKVVTTVDKGVQGAANVAMPAMRGAK